MLPLSVYMNSKYTTCRGVFPCDGDMFTRLGHYMANNCEIGMCGNEIRTLDD